MKRRRPGSPVRVPSSLALCLRLGGALALASSASVAMFVPMRALAEARDVRSFSTENQWSSTQINALGGTGHMSEELMDQFFSDPSLPQKRKAKFELQLGHAHAMWSRDLQKTVKDARSLQSSGGDSKGAAGTVDLLDGVRALFGRKLTAGTNISAFSLRSGGFTLAPYASAFVDGGADVPSWPAVAATADAYAGLGLGYGFVLGKRWELGMNVRPGLRAYAEADADVSAVGDFAGTSAGGEGGAEEFASYGTGLYLPADMGAGVMVTKDTRVNLVVRDVGGAPALMTLKGDTPPVYPMRLSLGGNSKLHEKGAHRFTLGSDVQDLLGIAKPNALWYRWQWAAQYAYRLGSRKETSLGLNGGLRSGYPAVGLFLDLFLLKLEGAWFTRETGFHVGQRPQQAWSVRAWSQLTF